MYKINEFSKKSNTSIQTLRYYDSINLFKPSYTDVFSNYRYYVDEQLNVIKKINNLKEIGLSLSDIKDYLTNNNKNILLKQKNIYSDRINKIEKILNMKDEINYQVIESNYKKFIEINGTRMTNTPMALEIKDNNAKYYILNKNDDFMIDFSIYNNNNWITIKKQYFKNIELMNNILSFLKKNGYEYVTNYIPVPEENILVDFIEKNYNVKKEMVKQGKWNYCHIRFDL